jgi:hypothetical protein
MQALASKQAQVLAYIQRQRQRAGQAPSYLDIAVQLGARYGRPPRMKRSR